MKIRGRVTAKDQNSVEIYSDGIIRTQPIDTKLEINIGDIIEIDETKKAQDPQILVRSKTKLPQIKTEQLQTLKNWNIFIRAVCTYFNNQGFLELRTPTLVVSPGLEPFLDPFETQFQLGSDSEKLFLPTSPEFHLKKALCQGFEKIFELKECFRNGEIGDLHQPEFLMLEWYRAYENLDAISLDLQNLLTHLKRELKFKGSVEVETIKMKDIWKRFLDFNLTPKTTIHDLKKFNTSGETDFDDLFTRIWLDKIEPELKKIPHPIIIYGFPPSQAALARLTTDGWADRLELYWKGLEIANGFNELNDSEEQRTRFKKDQEKKRKLGKEIVPIDEDFMKHLEWGMPPSAGIALGAERLFMAVFDVGKIQELRLFPMNKN